MNVENELRLAVHASRGEPAANMAIPLLVYDYCMFFLRADERTLHELTTTHSSVRTVLRTGNEVLCVYDILCCAFDDDFTHNCHQYISCKE
jgi:hypothetical protein